MSESNGSAKQLTVVQAIAAVMADVQAVGKTGRNSQQNYSFRGVDAVVNAVGPALRKHGVIVLPTKSDASYRDVTYGQNKTTARECTLKVQFTFFGPAGDSVTAEVSSEALDSGDKGTAKAHSVAYRTCLLEALSIPTDEPDPDSHSFERAAPVPVAAPEPPPPPSPRTRLARLIKEQGIDAVYAKQQMALLYGGVTATKDLTDEQVDDFIMHLSEGLKEPSF